MTITEAINQKSLSRFQRSFVPTVVISLILGAMITTGLIYNGAWKAAIMEVAKFALFLPPAFKCRRASLAPHISLEMALLLATAAIGIATAGAYGDIVLIFSDIQRGSH